MPELLRQSLHCVSPVASISPLEDWQQTEDWMPVGQVLLLFSVFALLCNTWLWVSSCHSRFSWVSGWYRVSPYVWTGGFEFRQSLKLFLVQKLWFYDLVICTGHCWNWVTQSNWDQFYLISRFFKWKVNLVSFPLLYSNVLKMVILMFEHFGIIFGLCS